MLGLCGMGAIIAGAYLRRPTRTRARVLPAFVLLFSPKQLPAPRATETPESLARRPQVPTWTQGTALERTRVGVLQTNGQ